MALLLGACIADNNQIGLLRTADGGIDVLYVRCLNYNEAVRTVRLRHGDSGDVIWRIKDARPISESVEEPELQRFRVGEVPEGFAEEVQLADPLAESQTYVLAIGGLHQQGFPLVQFELDDLSEDRVYGPVEASLQEFIESASEECQPPEPPLGRWGGPLVGLLLVAVFWLFAFAIPRFRRRSASGPPEVSAD